MLFGMDLVLELRMQYVPLPDSLKRTFILFVNILVVSLPVTALVNILTVGLIFYQGGIVLAPTLS